jgi:hypothetical protein
MNHSPFLLKFFLLFMNLLFILLNLFEVNGAVLGRDVNDTELSLVASLRQLPLLVPLKVVNESLLLHDLFLRKVL